MATGLKSWGEPTQSSGYLTLTRTTGTIYETSTGGQNTSEVITLTSVGIPNGTTVSLDQTVWINPDYGDPATPDVDFTVSSTVFTMNNNVGTITISAIEDYVTEGQETIKVQLQQLDSNGVNTGALATFFKLIDTSLSTLDCESSGAEIAAGFAGDPTTATIVEGTVVSINPSVYVAGSHTYTITIAVPAEGYSNSGDEIECNDTYTSQSYPVFTCADANFNVNTGGVGDIVTGTSALGTISSISPSTYSSGGGQHTYTANIIIPASGFQGGGNTIQCTDDTRSNFNCEEAGVTINAGFEGQVVTGSVANGTWLSVSPKLYVSGTNTYCVKVAPGVGYANSNTVDYITCCQQLTVLPGTHGRDEYFISTGRTAPELFCGSSYLVNTSVWVEEGHSINTALNEYVYTTENGNTKFAGYGRNYIVWPVSMVYNGSSQFTYWEISLIGQIDNVGVYSGCEGGEPGGNGKL